MDKLTIVAKALRSEKCNKRRVAFSSKYGKLLPVAGGQGGTKNKIQHCRCFELRSALRGDEWDKQEFVDRMKLVDEMIIDQTPIADRFVSRYEKKFGLSKQ